jgi:hypothetical protein
VLHDGTSSYLYGNGAERLRAAGGDWYVPDALGSVRATLDGAGTVLASTSYDPWGLPQAGAIAPFGFTGELHPTICVAPLSPPAPHTDPRCCTRRHCRAATPASAPAGRLWLDGGDALRLVVRNNGYQHLL